MYCGFDTSCIVSVYIQCQTSIYTLLLCRGHSWRVRLAKQETLTHPGHLVPTLMCRVRECPLWCCIVSATVTVHQFVCILHSVYRHIAEYFIASKPSRHSAVSGKAPTESGLDSWKNHEFKTRLYQKSVKPLIG